VTRRRFVQGWLGAGLAVLVPGLAGGVLTACSEAVDPTASAVIDLGTETGLLNFIYAVQQLELDYYSRIMWTTPFPGLLATEATTLNNAINQLTTSTQNLRTAIPAGRITDVIVFRTGHVIDPSDRGSVLTNAQIIEDAAAAGFAAVVGLVHTPSVVTLASTLAAQAAGRAAAIRTMAGSPAAPVTSRPPRDVVLTLEPYYLTTITVRG